MPPLSVLILGGLSSVGIELIKLLLSTPTTHIRVADRSIPALFPISSNYKQLLSRVEFLQINPCNPSAIATCFDLPDNQQFDVVYHCTTYKWEAPQEYYQSHLLDCTVHAAKEAAKRGIKVFVHQGSSFIYETKAGNAPCSEHDPLNTPHPCAKYYILTEEALAQIDGLNLVNARIGCLYGPTDSTSLVPGLLMAHMLNRAQIETVAQLNTDTPHHTIHCVDAARAMIHLANWYVDSGKSGIETFNVADQGNTVSLDLTRCFAEIYPHAYKYVGVPPPMPEEQSEAMRAVINEQIMGMWLYIVQENNIPHTHFTPYVYKESLVPLAVSLDTSKLMQGTGFTLQYPRITADALRECVKEYIKQGAWPTKSGPLPHLSSD